MRGVRPAVQRAGQARAERVRLRGGARRGPRQRGVVRPDQLHVAPRGQKFEVYRIGYNAVCCGNLPGGKAKNCPGKPSDTSAPEVWVDYRCHAPSRFVGTGLPPGAEPFLRRVDAMSETEVFEHYGMAHEKHAKALKRRVADLLDGGFERALLLAYSRQRRGNGEDYGNDFYYGVAPPCCATEEGGVQDPRRGRRAGRRGVGRKRRGRGGAGAVEGGGGEDAEGVVRERKRGRRRQELRGGRRRGNREAATPAPSLGRRREGSSASRRACGERASPCRYALFEYDV